MGLIVTKVDNQLSLMDALICIRDKSNEVPKQAKYSLLKFVSNVEDGHGSSVLIFRLHNTHRRNKYLIYYINPHSKFLRLIKETTSSRVAVNTQLEAVKNLDYFYKTKHGNEHWLELPHEDRRCVFLGDDSNCTVYNQRPISCRKYYVTSDPADCSVEGEPKIVQAAISMSAELYASATFEMMGFGSMPDMILKQLNISK